MAEVVKYGVLTVEKARQAEAEGEVVQFVVNPALLEPLVRWLDERDADLVQIPSDEDDLPTFIAAPRNLRG